MTNMRPKTIERLRTVTEHLTLLTLGDGRSEQVIRTEIFDYVRNVDEEPDTTYLLALGMFSATLNGIATRYDIPAEDLMGLFGQITGAAELAPTPQELHPSHPRWHQS